MPRWIARSLLAGLLLSAASATLFAATNPGAEDLPDFNGVWTRAPEPEFLPVPGDNEGKPITKLPVTGPDAGEIIAGNWDNPFLLPWTREVVKENAVKEMRLEHIFQADDSCWPVAVPQILNLREAVQFVQAKDKLLIIYQRDHLVRQIHFAQKHADNVKPSWFGDSIGRWDGDTLVVETRNLKFNHQSRFGVGYLNGASDENLRVVERFTRTNATTLTYRATVEDPTVFTRPWTIEVPMDRADGAIYEVGCHEGNYGMFNILSGHRAEERRAAEAARREGR